MPKTWILMLLAMGMLSCTPSPKAITYGSDVCHFCKMTIVDPRHGAEVVSAKGKIFMFDAIECMVDYVNQNPQEEFAYLLVNDYLSPSELHDAMSCQYLVSESIPSPMGAYLSAFSSSGAVQKTWKEKGGKIFDWAGILADRAP